MKPICSELKERLAAEGAQALRSDAVARKHLEECADCYRVLEQLARLDAALAAMPAHDATDRVVADLIGRVRADSAPARGVPAEPFAPPRATGRPWLWALATAASVVFAFVMVTPSLMRARIAPRPAVTDGFAVPLSENLTVPPATTLVPEVGKKGDRDEAGRFCDGETRAFQRNGELDKEQQERLRSLGSLSEDRLASPAPAKPKPEAHYEVRSNEERERAATRGDELDSRRGKVAETGKDLGNTATGSEGVLGGVVGGTGDRDGGAVRVGGDVKAPKRIRGDEPFLPQAGSGGEWSGSKVVPVEILIDASGRVRRARILRSVPALDAAAVQAVLSWAYEPTLLNGRAVAVIMTVSVEFRSRKPTQDEPAQAFLDERSTTDVAFQAASGYWANTYLPGDPVLRMLRARLRGSPVRLHEAAAQPSQPFDPPTQSGLALYLSADRRAIEKPSRMLLQVGLKGSPRPAGHRPPMSVALVLDLRGERNAESAADMRALALAFAEAREAGDRFSLIVAGPNGGVVVPPDRFKHGPLAVALERRMMGAAAEVGPVLDLPGAVAAALLQAGQCEDPDAALGGSAVVLVTAQPLGDAVAAVEDLAHQGAVAGIPLSVVSVGSGATSAGLDRIALAGQGSRRHLDARAAALRVVEAELTSASDVVARAVRLRIRLAPQVRLVEVVGSRRLDEAQAQRLREAEQSVDLRLSRLLGIDSDRGLDEDGIQVVIPSFHAGDDHVILLDVVAEGPGALADVSVRYKDVAFLRNGSARASLRLPAGAAAAGPIERNVLKNLLALRLAQGFAAAGDALDAGDAAQASALVGRACSLRAALLERIPGLGGDVELLRDVALLQDYSRALSGPQLDTLADSLRYAGRLKQLSRPASRATGIL